MTDLPMTDTEREPERAPSRDTSAADRPESAAPVLEVLGDPGVGVCVDDVCLVPGLEADAVEENRSVSD